MISILSHVIYSWAVKENVLVMATEWGRACDSRQERERERERELSVRVLWTCGPVYVKVEV
jgi:hypothetical protein